MRQIIALLSFLLLVAPLGCIPVNLQELLVRDARITANVAAMTLEATHATALVLYYTEQRLTVEREKVKEGMTKEKLRAKIANIRTRWAPVWEQFDKAQQLHMKIATSLEQQSGNVLELTTMSAQYVQAMGKIGSELAAARKRVGVDG